jgi:hypothetical protein
VSVFLTPLWDVHNVSGDGSCVGAKGAEESGMVGEVSASGHPLCDLVCAWRPATRMDALGIAGTVLQRI